jgi:hypothetical protein
MKEKSKEAKESMKVKEGGLHRNKYDGRYMKQRVKISKVT